MEPDEVITSFYELLRFLRRDDLSILFNPYEKDIYLRHGENDYALINLIHNQ
jgi:hypothetical protein